MIVRKIIITCLLSPNFDKQLTSPYQAKVIQRRTVVVWSRNKFGFILLATANM